MFTHSIHLFGYLRVRRVVAICTIDEEQAHLFVSMHFLSARDERSRHDLGISLGINSRRAKQGATTRRISFWPSHLGRSGLATRFPPAAIIEFPSISRRWSRRFSGNRRARARVKSRPLRHGEKACFHRVRGVAASRRGPIDDFSRVINSHNEWCEESADAGTAMLLAAWRCSCSATSSRSQDHPDFDDRRDRCSRCSLRLRRSAAVDRWTKELENAEKIQRTKERMTFVAFYWLR